MQKPSRFTQTAKVEAASDILPPQSMIPAGSLVWKRQDAASTGQNLALFGSGGWGVTFPQE
jgi:hypothetical protein